jgi:hypothetical protein
MKYEHAQVKNLNYVVTLSAPKVLCPACLQFLFLLDTVPLKNIMVYLQTLGAN